MNIAFFADHPYWGQLGNNGGTRTMLKSADVLRSLGHTVSVVAHKDKFTWFDHPKPVPEIPRECDTIIAVSISDMKMLLRTYKGNAKLAYWARPYETWHMPMDKICKWMNKLIKRGGLIMCNSGWQVRQLHDNGIEAKLVYSGLDNDWHPSEHKVLNRIGCLYSKRASKRWKWFDELHGLLGPTFEYVAFGMGKCEFDFLSTYLENPSHEKLEELYQSCAFFFCPNKREGFYNCGYEAAMCGCLLVTSDGAENGMSDYATQETSHIFHTVEDAANQIKAPDFGKIERMNAVLKNIGDRATNMKRMIGVLNEHH